jgi:hypothetical protein
MPQVFSWPDRMTGFSRLSRFGMTCELLTGDHGAGLLTWFLAGFPARTSARRERARESTGSEADCGRRWGESLARWDRDSCSWRTHQFSLLGGLELFSETWPRWGMMRGGACWGLSMPVRRISGSGSGLWPTPRASENDQGSGADAMMEGVSSWKAQGRGATLTTAVKQQMWPTPMASEGRQGFQNRNNGKKGTQESLTTVIQRGRAQESGGALNPTWVEWLMGWPLGWTDLRPLGMDRFQRWRCSHGGCCMGMGGKMKDQR